MNNYALGGASKYAPRNTLSAFYTALIMGADGIKTEIRLSKDNTAVLFSRDNLEHFTDAFGNVEDYTAQQLKNFKVFNNNGFFDRIITLEEFLSFFSAYDIKLILELIAQDADEKVLSLINKYRVVKNTVIASREFDCLETVRKKCDYVKLGLIADSDVSGSLQTLKETNISTVCLNSKVLTEQSTGDLRERGLYICAYNVTDTKLMKKVCSFGVDAVITGFPDKAKKCIINV